MNRILKGHFDGFKHAYRAPPASSQLLAQRYHIDRNGRRVLVGLTPAETREFETLDSLSPSDHGGWIFGGEPTTALERRWLELYARHDEAWKAASVDGGRGLVVSAQNSHRNVVTCLQLRAFAGRAGTT